jgi:arylsulfatase A-like enzyme
MAAAAAAGLLEAWLQGVAAAPAVCAAGAAAFYVAPAGFVMSVAARGLWRAWRPLVAPGPDGDGARLFAGAVYAALAAIALGGAGFGVAHLVLLGDDTSAALSPGAVAAALAAAAALVLAASRPSVLALSRAARAAGLRRPRSAVIAVGILAGILAAGVWLGVVGPALARIDYDYAGYGWTAVAVLVLGHAVAARLGPGWIRWAAGGAAALACLALVAGAITTRMRDPAALFDAWYRMPVGGLAIGFTYDVDDLRSEILPGDLAPRPRPGAPHPDIVVVTIDTLRADQLRLYGGEARMPTLEGLARRGVTFDWVFAPSNNTRQSVSSMMTGVSPARLRGRVVEFALKLDPRHVVVSERFRAAGYATAGFLCCPNHLGGRKKIGLDRGLESVAYQRSGRQLVAMAGEWLGASAGESRPRYLWLHMFEPHDWQRDGGGPDGETDPAARYRRSIERADRLLAPLVAAVESGGRPTILVVTSDHGEGLGDHGALRHASNLYNSQTRVPLVVVGPGLSKPRRVTDTVALLELAPTLLDLAGFEPPGMPAMDGSSFASLVRGVDRKAGEAASDREAYSVMVRDRSVARSGRALVAGRYKLIAVDGRRMELYDLAADPLEAKNLARRQPQRVTDLAARLARRREADAVPPF